MPHRIPKPSTRWLMHLAVVCGVSACSVLPTVPISGIDAAATGTPKQFRDRQILVTLTEAHEKQWNVLAESLRRDYGLHATGAFPLRSIGLQCLVYRVPVNLDVAETVEKLRGDKRIEHVQLNREFDGLAAIYNDRYATMQHGMHEIRAADVHALSTGRGIRVAVIDTGVDVAHPDLRERIVHTENFVEGGETTFNADAHGTAVAGVIGAQANNGIGVFGAAPNAAIMAYKACWYSGHGETRARCSSWTLAKAIDRAILDRAQIINLSLAGPYDMLLERLIKRATAAGIVVVAAMNDVYPSAMGFPANLDDVIAVVSMPQGSGTPGVANAPGRHTIVAAPGNEILTAMPNNRYDFVSGSSLAAAHVTGVIALMLGSNANLTVKQIHEFMSTASQMKTEVTPAMRQIDACLVFTRMLGRRICTDTGAPAMVDSQTK